MASPHLSLIRENRRSEAPLCGTVKIAGTKRDRPFSSGKKYLEVKAGSGKPGKTCIPLWTRSIDAREQGQVFWLVSPRAVFPPPEGDSDCSDRPTHGKRLTAAGTAPDSEHGSSPDSLLRLLRRGETPPLPDETKLNTFFYRTTLSTTDFHPPGKTSGTRARTPSEKASATKHARTATSLTALSLPRHSIAAYLLYRIVLPSLPPAGVRSLPSPPRSARANPCPTSQQASTGNSRSDLPAPYGRLRRRKPPEPRRNERRHRPENGNRPIKRKRQASARLAAFVRGRIAPRISYIPYPSSEIRSYTTLKMPSSRIPALQATRLTRV